MKLSHMPFESTSLLEGAVIFRASYGLGIVGSMHDFSGYGQWFYPKIWDKGINIWCSAIHGFETVAFPSC